MSAAVKRAIQVALSRSGYGALKHPSRVDLSKSFSYLSPKISSFKLHHPARCCCRGSNCFNVDRVCGVLTTRARGLADKRSPEAYNCEKELSQFLVEEIEAEKQLMKGSVPDRVGDFSVKLEGSEVVLWKKCGEDNVEVCFNINHTVDSEESQVEPAGASPEMKSRPNFEVEISRGGKTLGFSCSMIPPTSNVGDAPPEPEAYNDLFAIDEVVMYSGEWKDSNYSAGGDVLDGTLYDMFMDLLEDKGINNEFVEKLSDFSTKYEHSRYISMLEDIQKFCTSPK